MKFSVIRNGEDFLRDRLMDQILERCAHYGHEYTSDSDEINFVFNLTTLKDLHPYRRRSKAVLVVSVVTDVYSDEESIRSKCYTALIQSLSNLLIYFVPRHDSKVETYFITPEAGFYHLRFEKDDVYRRIHPVISSRLATDNMFSSDLPLYCCNSTPVVEQMKHYSRILDEMGVLPTPFPLREVLTEDAMNHLYKIFGITGASYGNISAREDIPELGPDTFWMTARGVNKANIQKIGRDILLVKGINENSGEVQLSVPIDYYKQARVSVDAFEHAMIYRRFPQVGAIVHVHAWMEGIACTRQNYPCGTIELANEVVSQLALAENPAQSVIGLKNHGISITGYDLDDIFSRIGNRLEAEVQMYA